MRMIHLAAGTAMVALLALASLTACGQAQVAPTATAAVQTITVTLTDTTITASTTTVHPGVRCHFLVTNNGTVQHRFLIMPQGMAQMMGRMPMARWPQQPMFTSQAIGPGMMAQFDYTFTMPMMQQHLAFGSYADGQPLMEMPFTVRS